MAVSGVALGQTAEELGLARSQFQEALSLEVAGDFPSALVKLQQVAKVKLTPQVRYHLARCKEHLGRLTEALGDYRVATTEARQTAVAELEEFERALADLERRVPRLVFKLPPGAASASIELDGVKIVVREATSPIPVDPGVRRIVVGTARTGTQVTYVNALEGQTIEVPVSDQVRSSAPGESVPVAKVSSGAPVAAYVAAAFGTVAIASSVALFAVRNSAINTLESRCSNGVCPEDLRSTAERGRFASWAAPTALGIGLGAVSLAAWGFWPKAHPATTRGGTTAQQRVYVSVYRDFAGIRLSSEF